MLGSPGSGTPNLFGGLSPCIWAKPTSSNCLFICNTLFTVSGYYIQWKYIKRSELNDKDKIVYAENTYIVKIIIFNILHYHLQLVFTIDDSLFKKLHRLSHQLQLVNNLFKSRLRLWLQLSISDTFHNLLCWTRHFFFSSRWGVTLISDRAQILHATFLFTCASAFAFFVFTHCVS